MCYDALVVLGVRGDDFCSVGCVVVRVEILLTFNHGAVNMLAERVFISAIKNLSQLQHSVVATRCNNRVMRIWIQNHRKRCRCNTVFFACFL